MMRVLIVDDEPPARRKVRRFLERDADIASIVEASCGTDAVSLLREVAVDLVFLDVSMPDMDGFAVLAAVPEPHDFHVVFLTAYSEHALRAFDADALDYLLKPVSPARFERALERVKARVAAFRQQPAAPASHRFLKRLVVPDGGREIFLSVQNLDWAEASRNYVQLYAGNEAFIVRQTLDSLARALDPDQFLRINRSQLVNLDRVREMQPWFHGERRIILTNGRELTWTRRFRAPRQAGVKPPSRQRSLPTP
jgi:two-component system, LytTR family, response regulator